MFSFVLVVLLQGVHAATGVAAAASVTATALLFLLSYVCALCRQCWTRQEGELQRRFITRVLQQRCSTF
jgi:hypothetical protein